MKVECKCIEIIQDTSGVTVGYTFQDRNGKKLSLPSDITKRYISNGQFIVENLTLTKDKRLINKHRDEVIPKRVKENTYAKPLPKLNEEKLTVSSVINRIKNKALSKPMAFKMTLANDEVTIVPFVPDSKLYLLYKNANKVEAYNESDVTIVKTQPGGISFKVTKGDETLWLLPDKSTTAMARLLNPENTNSKNITDLRSGTAKIKMIGGYGLTILSSAFKDLADQINIDTLDISMLNLHHGISIAGFLEYLCANQVITSGFQAPGAESTSSMFEHAKIKNLKLETPASSEIRYMADMFRNSEIGTLDLSKFSFDHAYQMSSMFRDAKIGKLILPKCKYTLTAEMFCMFTGSVIPEVDLSALGDLEPNEMRSMFDNSKIGELNLGKLVIPPNTSAIFNGAHIGVLDAHSLRIGADNSTGDLFLRAKIHMLILKGFDASNVTSTFRMFGEAEIPEIDLGGIDFSNVSTANSMFEGCKADRINLIDFYPQPDANISNIFKNCDAQVDLPESDRMLEAFLTKDDD